jgi:hypothetical protein
MKNFAVNKIRCFFSSKSSLFLIKLIISIIIMGSVSISSFLLHPSAGATISDTGANIVKNLVALQAQTTKIQSITQTDPATALSINFSQYLADTVVSKISGSYQLNVSGVSATGARIGSNVHIKSMNVNDTSTNIQANINLGLLGALAAQNTKINSITLTDPSNPIAISQSQSTNNASTIAKLIGTYKLGISGATATQAISDLNNSHVSSIIVVDSAANITANQEALRSQTVNITKLPTSANGSINLTRAEYYSYSTAIGNSAIKLNINLSNLQPTSQLTNIVNGLHNSNVKLNYILDEGPSTPTTNLAVQNWTRGDTIGFTSIMQVKGFSGTAIVGKPSINATTGIVSFASGDVSLTLNQKVAAIKNSMARASAGGEVGKGNVAIFDNGLSHWYVLVTGLNSGSTGLGANDALVSLGINNNQWTFNAGIGKIVDKYYQS